MASMLWTFLSTPNKVGFEHVISDVQMHRKPIGDQHASTHPEVQRKLVLFGEFDVAHADRHVKRRIEGPSPPEEHLAGQYVVAHVQVVIREVSPRVADDRDVGKYVLEAAQARLRARGEGLEEKILRHVVGRARAVDRVGAEILDAQRAEVRAHLEVLGLDLRRLHFPARHLRLDDRGLRLRLLHGHRRRLLVAAMEPAAAGQQRCR